MAAVARGPEDVWRSRVKRLEAAMQVGLQPRILVDVEIEFRCTVSAVCAVVEHRVSPPVHPPYDAP